MGRGITGAHKKNRRSFTPVLLRPNRNSKISNVIIRLSACEKSYKKKKSNSHVCHYTPYRSCCKDFLNFFCVFFILSKFGVFLLYAPFFLVVTDVFITGYGDWVVGGFFLFSSQYSCRVVIPGHIFHLAGSRRWLAGIGVGRQWVVVRILAAWSAVGELQSRPRENFAV